ncbi:MAG TPA: uracil-DNA glycosylase, partial [Aggregicoccus sp.]|nr:uracil-DNA glycosylase [Aggregicoccus sp.]
MSDQNPMNQELREVLEDVRRHLLWQESDGGRLLLVDAAQAKASAVQARASATPLPPAASPVPAGRAPAAAAPRAPPAPPVPRRRSWTSFERAPRASRTNA